ncbi:MAG: dihydrofolate reductase [Bacteroidia bacterium]|nr:dihydrofolate reductase [Bacteroidia bacterium]MDW8235267.1 dihydrofolate reductase [Bacteroidia bacterium]
MWSLIAALSYPQRIIGKEGKLPWHLPLELRLFRQQTWGGILVVGRRTLETLPLPLPGRDVWVLSHSLAPQGDYYRVFPNPESLLQALSDVPKPVFFAGGASLYAWALQLPQLQKMFLTWVFLSVEGDTFFPFFAEHEWSLQRWELFTDKGIPFIRAEYERNSR